MTIIDSSPRFVIDFDHHDAEFRDNNKEVVARLHATGRKIGWSEAHGGYWAFFGYDAVYDAVQDWELFSSLHDLAGGCPKGVPGSTNPTQLLPIDADGPMVHEYRKLLLSWFSPGTAKADEQRIRDICNELIDTFIESGQCDLTNDLLMPLPARLILEKLDWQPERWGEWIEWVHGMIHDRTSNPEKSQRDIEAIFGNIVQEMIKRREQLGDDLFSDLLQAQIAGKALEDPQIIGYSILLLLGGMDTTAGLTGNVIALLDQRHDLRQQLIDDPSLWPTALEEFLRHDSPSYGLYRTVTRDAVFHGEQLRKGERVVLMFPAAGLDPNVYPDPDGIDLRRTGNRHMAFGLGPHRCLGSHHARVMSTVMLSEVLRRMPDFRVAGELHRFADAGDVYAIKSLPLTFTPGPRSH